MSCFNCNYKSRHSSILGMMLFMGLQRTELESLQLEHLDLDNVRLFVPESPSTNERYIPLHPKQMMHLSQYIYDLRPKLLQYFNKETNQLFFSSGVGNNLNGALARMLKRIKLECHYVRDFKQLRQSRMVIWVKEHGLREAQYLGGYRYVTSVQRYDFKSLDKLHKLLEFHHPMEKMVI
jgi:site-specific recombinase XerD